MLTTGIVVDATDVRSAFEPTGEDPIRVSQAGLDTYSDEQQSQIMRIAPIKYCTLPEYHLAEAIPTVMPKSVLESKEAYETRKTRAPSAFEPYYDHLRNLIVGVALRKGVQLSDSSSEWEAFTKNVDLEGSSITSFAKKNFTDALDGGISAIWVEYPKVPQPLLLQEEERLGLRPYFVSIKCEDILEVRSEIINVELNGKTVLGRFPTFVRLRATYETISEENPYVLLKYPAVRIYVLSSRINPNTQQEERYVKWELYAKMRQESEDYDLVGDGVLSIDFIPFVPTYGGKVEAYCRARPQLLDIARLNLHHWIMSADLAYQMSNASCDHLYGTGVRQEEDLSLESDKILIAESPEAEFGMLNRQMNGADAILANLARIEKSMERLAAVAMTTSKTQAESGFSKLLDRSQSDSQLAVLVQSFEDSLNLAFSYAGKYYKKTPPSATISKDFVPVKLHSQQIMAYISMFKETPMPIKLFLDIMNAGEIYEGIENSKTNEILQLLKLDGSETALELGYALGGGVAGDNRTLVGTDPGDPSESGESSTETPESASVTAASS